MAQADLAIARTVADLRTRVRDWRQRGQRIALVPTMGALHDGHLSLIAAARRAAETVIASIFVNPMQFGATEDLGRYPRQEAEDARLLAEAGCNLLFLPGVDEVYPTGFATRVDVRGLTDMLCGTVRPGHFEGVATVVAKLLNMAGADVAVFGEKDFQQLHVIRRMARDLDIPTQILGAPLLRDVDGLALSSRNAYLSDDERRAARALPRSLEAAKVALESGADVAATLAQVKQTLHDAGFAAIDYVELRAEDDLSDMPVLERPARLLAAARMGTTRLIDNMAVRRDRP